MSYVLTVVSVTIIMTLDEMIQNGLSIGFTMAALSYYS